MAVEKTYKCDACQGTIEYGTRYTNLRFDENTLFTEEQQNHYHNVQVSDPPIYFEVCMKCINEKPLLELYTMYVMKREAAKGRKGGYCYPSEAKGMDSCRKGFWNWLHNIIHAIFGWNY